MQKCVTCQYYDRRNVGPVDGKSPSWGQCRRTAPMLHPVNVKSYMIEGVWPHVRDDDWCGEWKVLARRGEARPTENLTTPMPAATPAPATRISPLPGPVPVPERAMIASGAHLMGGHGASD